MQVVMVSPMCGYPGAHTRPTAWPGTRTPPSCARRAPCSSLPLRLSAVYLCGTDRICRWLWCRVRRGGCLSLAPSGGNVPLTEVSGRDKSTQEVDCRHPRGPSGESAPSGGVRGCLLSWDHGTDGPRLGSDDPTAPTLASARRGCCPHQIGGRASVLGCSACVRRPRRQLATGWAGLGPGIEGACVAHGRMASPSVGQARSKGAMVRGSCPARGSVGATGQGRAGRVRVG